MIKKTKSSNNLRAFSAKIPFVDKDGKSKDYFRVHGFPEVFYAGKNSFRICGNNDKLVDGSTIYIDVLDANNDVVYHEILDVINDDKSRTVVVYIYPDTPPGELRVYIASRLQRHPLNDITIPYDDEPLSPHYKHIPNIIWVGASTVVPTAANDSDIVFTKEPEIEFYEKLARYETPITSSRYTEYKAENTASVSIQSVIQPFQFSDTQLRLESQQTSNVVSVNPSVENNRGTTTPNLQLPEHSQPSILRSNSGVFTSAMKGGTITVRNILVADQIPKDAASTASFAVQDFSASILNIVNNKTIEIDRPFIFDVQYTITDGATRNIIFNRFVNATNFTCSYYSDNVSVTQSRGYESVVVMEVKGAEPLTGTIDKVEVSYKPVGSLGEFTNVGAFTIREQNILVNTSSLELTAEDGLQEKKIGVFKSQTDVDTYWTSSANSNVLVTMSYDSSRVMNGMRVTFSGSLTETQYVSVYPTQSYTARAIEGTEYKLSFAVNSENDSGAFTDALMDVYISGSDVSTDIIKKSDALTILRNREIGDFIGSISKKDSNNLTHNLYFIANKSAQIKPVFVIRSGKWAIGNISLSPRKDVGFSPNYFKLNIPMASFQRSSELILDVKYLNKSGRSSNVSSKLYGVFFSGSTPLDFADLQNKPVLVSSSAQVVGGMDKSVQFNYSGSMTGSNDFTYDPVNKVLKVGVNAAISDEDPRPSNFVIRNTAVNNSHPYFKLERSGAYHSDSPVLVVTKDNVDSSSAAMGIGISSPKSTVDMLVKTQHSANTKLEVARAESGSGITLSKSASVGEGSYYKLLNVTNTISGSGNQLSFIASKNNGFTYLHIGLENSNDAGLGTADTTWVSFGSGSLYSKEFSGSGYELNNLDWNKIINKGGIISSSAQVEYDTLINKPVVESTGSRRILINMNNPSHSVGLENLTHTSMSVADDRINMACVLNLKKGMRLVHFRTSSFAGAYHRVMSREYIYETKASLQGGTPSVFYIPVELSSYEGNRYTGSMYSSALNFNVETMIYGVSGSPHGAIDAHAWASTVQGRATVSPIGSGRPIFYTPYIVSGGQDKHGAYGFGRSGLPDYNRYYVVSYTTASSQALIVNTITLPISPSYMWDAHIAVKINQLIYEVDTFAGA